MQRITLEEIKEFKEIFGVDYDRFLVVSNGEARFAVKHFDASAFNNYLGSVDEEYSSVDQAWRGNFVSMALYISAKYGRKAIDLFCKASTQY